MSKMSAKVDDSSENGECRSWRGCSMVEIHRHMNEFELEHVPPVRPSDAHTVLYHFPIRAADAEPPQPLHGHHKWDAHHVRLPCSAKSQYPVTAEDGRVTIESRWEMIEKALLRPIADSHELEEAILAYNTRYRDQWKFRALHKLFGEELDESETQVFFEDLLPRIIRLALRLPDLVQSAIPLLKQGHTHSVTLTQEQIACLLANGFLCTFPRRNTLKRKSEYSTFPDINFNRLFQSSGHHVLEKIKCICHYFRRVCPTEQSSSNVPTGVVTFTRRSLQHSDMPNWSECAAPLSETLLHITSQGTIEDQGLGLLQVDFANKFLGGGVLGGGCVQEEIRFVICPELLISKLFTECLRPTEALLMVGCERYSNYTGYASSFQWAGDHEDATPRDSSRRRQTHIVAIDALAFLESSHQYREEMMLRELNKAYVGFFHPLETPAPGVASGNWGCGAFGGEAALKALIQLMACAATKRPLVYYTFGNTALRDAVHELHAFLGGAHVRVCDLWSTLKKFHKQRLDHKELYNYIYSCHGRNAAEKLQKPAELHSKKVQSTLSQHFKAGPSAPTETHPTVEGSTYASTSQAGAQQRQHNRSPNIFVASSDAESDSGCARERDESCSTSRERELSRTAISDDSEMDEQLLQTPAAESPPTKPESRQSPTLKSPPSSSVKKRSEPRQRTLLEMLDQCHTDGSQPKRPKS